MRIRESTNVGKGLTALRGRLSTLLQLRPNISPQQRPLQQDLFLDISRNGNETNSLLNYRRNIKFFLNASFPTVGARLYVGVVFLLAARQSILWDVNFDDLCFNLVYGSTRAVGG